MYSFEVVPTDQAKVKIKLQQNGHLVGYLKLCYANVFQHMIKTTTDQPITGLEASDELGNLVTLTKGVAPDQKQGSKWSGQATGLGEFTFWQSPWGELELSAYLESHNLRKRIVLKLDSDLKQVTFFDQRGQVPFQIVNRKNDRVSFEWSKTYLTPAEICAFSYLLLVAGNQNFTESPNQS